MSISKSKRIDSLNFFKGIACILIVLLHCPFPSAAGEVFRAVSRFAVPLFFAVSGYFLLDNDGNTYDRARIKKKLLHIVYITLYAVGFYIIFHMALLAISPKGKLTDILQCFNAESIIRFFVTNSPFVYSHLWFLYALIYCYLTVLLINRFLKGRWKLFYIIASLLCFTLVSEFLPCFGIEGSITSFDIGIRNFFFLRAFPFMILGVFLKQHKDALLNLKPSVIRLSPLIILFGMGLSVLEKYLFADSQFYIGSYITLIFIFVFCVNKPESLNKPIEFMGDYLSLDIYIFHIAVIKILDTAESKLSLSGSAVYQWAKPLLVIGIVVTLSYVLCRIRKYCKSRRAR